MDSTLVWILISVGVVVGITLIVALIVANRSPSGVGGGPLVESDDGMSPDAWVSLGTVFTGAGVALWLTIGPAMLGMVALGIAYFVIGIMKKRAADRSA
jgi:uncharacterized membrane protein